MDIESYARWWLDQEGNYIERMQALGGTTTSESNAKQQVIGINFFCKHLLDRLGEDFEEWKDKYNYSFAEDGSQTREKIIVLSEDEMQSPAVIMEKMGLDPVRWELEKCELERKGWDVTMKMNKGTNKDGDKLPDQPLTRTNYAFNCKIRVRPITDKIDSSIIRQVVRDIEVPAIEEYEYCPASLMYELPVMDLHLGKHAWGEETGNGNYDVKIAEVLYKKTIADFISRMDDNYHKFLFPVGQDFFHIDDKRELTTAGTHVDTDGRWQKIYRTGIELLVWAIEQLRKRAPVDVMYVPGNHDEMLSYCAVVSLAHRYDKTDSVSVDLSPAPRKYRQFGRGLVGFTHGKEGSKNRLEKIMQVEQPELWGATRFREMHMGDRHSEKVWETGGIIFRRISSVTETDAWHNEKAYKGAIRKAQAFVWDDMKGVVDIVNSVVEIHENEL